jgi:protein-disulfide isomerase
VPIGDSPIRGPRHAKVTVAVYAEFECGFCRTAALTLARLQKSYGKDVRLVFKHFPTMRAHKNARLAARASIAAGNQGKFWEMHDLMFEHFGSLSREHLLDHARKLRLDELRFINDLDTGGNLRIDEDIKIGAGNGLRGVPVVFINGRPVMGSQPDSDYRVVIDEELKKASELMKSGVKLEELYEKLLTQ